MALPPAGASEWDERLVRGALMALPPRDQAVLSLHHVEGLSVEQVGLVLGWKIGTVKSRLFRAREALRAKLEAWPRGEGPAGRHGGESRGLGEQSALAVMPPVARESAGGGR